MKEPIAFNFLLGESGWRAKQQEVYQQLQVWPLHFLIAYKPNTQPNLCFLVVYRT